MQAHTGGNTDFSDKLGMNTEDSRLGSCGAVFIILKTALGAGLLNFPWAFSQAGGVQAAVTVEMVSNGYFNQQAKTLIIG